jgi:hypothetical protein
MERRKITRSELFQILILETDRVLGMSAISLRGKIAITPRDGEPNWDASCAIAGTVVSRAFAVALERVRGLYDLKDSNSTDDLKDSNPTDLDLKDSNSIDLDALKFFARKTLDVDEWNEVKSRMDNLRVTLGSRNDFMMFSAETEDPEQVDIYIGFADSEMLDTFPGFTPIERSSLLQSLAVHLVPKDELEQGDGHTPSTEPRSHPIQRII